MSHSDWSSLLKMCPILLATTLASTGCIGSHPSNPAATQPTTAIDPKEALPEYWLDKPGVASIQSGDFDKLWAACQAAAESYLFNIDRVDYRLGLITTAPVVSRQPLEFWRGDTPLPEDAAKSAVATIRRTIRFNIMRTENGRYEAVPRVLVERYSLAETRITCVVEYHSIFGVNTTHGSREIDDGVVLPPAYWYATGRDEVLERHLADNVRGRL